MARKSATRNAGKGTTGGRAVSRPGSTKGGAGRGKQTVKKNAGGSGRAAKGTRATGARAGGTTSAKGVAARKGVAGKKTAAKPATAKAGRTAASRAAAGRKAPKASGAVAASGKAKKAKAIARNAPAKTGGGRAKVGSDSAAAAKFAARKDFGTPARKAKPRGRSPDSAEGLPRNEQGRSGEAGDRTHGVGTAPAGVGSGSGGDVDTDFIGVGIDPVAQEAPVGVTEGPAATTGGSEEFASGPPARGEGQLPPGTHGAASNRTYDTVDHTGGEVGTADWPELAHDLGESELTSDEAGGQDNDDIADRDNQ